jgi:hypothetical protein
VVLQALKPAFLVVHGSEGTVYFARQLAEGEAFRSPGIGGLTIDVSEPDAFQVFVGGQSKGLLPRPLTDIATLLGVAPAAKPGQAGAKPAVVAATAKPASSKPAPTAPTAKAAAPVAAKPAGGDNTPPF